MTTIVSIQAGHKGAIVFVESDSSYEQPTGGTKISCYSSTEYILPPSGKVEVVVTDTQEVHISEPDEALINTDQLRQQGTDHG